MNKFKEENLKENLNKRKIVAFVPARGGSKSIPFKNIKIFCGKPLLFWTLQAASECTLIDEIYVATDHESIREVVHSFELKKVKVVSRSSENSSDTATTESSMLEFAENYSFDHIVLIQATSPLTEKEDLEKGLNTYFNNSCDSLISVVKQKRFLWCEKEEWAFPENYNPLFRPRRQDWNGLFVENGAFYITSKDALLKSKCRVSGKIKLYEMPEDTYFEIDSTSDWQIAEQLKRNRLLKSENYNKKLDNINLLICDVDGVLTDAGMYYSNLGDELKKFNTRDGKGIENIRQAGIKVMFLTSENVDLVKKRAEKLKVDFLFMGVKEKKTFLERFFETNNEYNFSKTAYIGDDINDLDCLIASYFSAAPNNGHEKIKEVASYICQYDGGQGCVREVCDVIMSRRGHD